MSVDFLQRLTLKKIDSEEVCDGDADRNSRRRAVHRNHFGVVKVQRVWRANVRLFVSEVTPQMFRNGQLDRRD